MRAPVGPALALFLLACACGSGGSGSVHDTLGPKLHARAFLSESLSGRTLVADTQIRLGFDQGELNANAGCNHLFGRYRIEGDRLRMDEMGSTEMGCDAELHAQDEWLAALLTGSPTITIAEPRITLSTASARLTLLDRRVASPDRPLVGTRWIGNGSGEEQGGMTFGPGSDAAALTFGAGGQVEVFTACQRGRGTFSATAQAIAFTQLAYDGAACPEPNFEPASRDVLFVLDGSPVTFDIHEASLTLRRAGRVLMFRAER